MKAMEQWTLVRPDSLREAGVGSWTKESGMVGEMGNWTEESGMVGGMDDWTKDGGMIGGMGDWTVAWW